MALIIVTADGTRYEFKRDDIVTLTYSQDVTQTVNDLHERVEDSIVAERQDYVTETPPETDTPTQTDEPIIEDTKEPTIAAKVEAGTIEDRAIDHILDKATAPPSYVENACDQKPFTIDTVEQVTKAVTSSEDKAAENLVNSFIGNETPTTETPVAEAAIAEEPKPKAADATIQEI